MYVILQILAPLKIADNAAHTCNHKSTKCIPCIVIVWMNLFSELLFYGTIVSCWFLVKNIENGLEIAKFVNAFFNALKLPANLAQETIYLRCYAGNSIKKHLNAYPMFLHCK